MYLSYLFLSPFLLVCCTILSVHAVNLDEKCDKSVLCTVLHSICSNSTCVCDTPYYLPCNINECKLNAIKFRYAGEECRVNENCLEFSKCVNKICVCDANYSNQERGLCRKSFNIACAKHEECLSGYCSTTCKCAPGYVIDGNKCKLRVLDIYSNFEDAKKANSLCEADEQCQPLNSNCSPESNTTDRFCKCITGYNADYKKQQCDPTRSEQLSPLYSSEIFEGECVACKDPNAICTRVGN
ncbi:unnamed protein product, partial [Didymodactylos carnosus]